MPIGCLMETLSPETYLTVLEALPVGVYLVDLDRRILLWNSGAEELTGYLRHEVIGRACRDDLLMHCDENDLCFCANGCPLQHTMHDGKPRRIDAFLLHKDGRRVPVSVRAAPLRDEHGAIIGAVECFDRRQVFPTADSDQSDSKGNAPIDILTGLLDRPATETRLSEYLESYGTSRIPFGLTMVVIDGLDRLHHRDGPKAVGAILRATGRTLASAMGPHDMIGRWSDDRFLGVVTSCSPLSLYRGANMLKRLVKLERVPWWGDRLTVTLSIGGTVVQEGDTLESMVGRAESALQQSLAQHGDHVVVV